MAKECKLCGAPFIPTPEYPEICDLCIRYPELRPQPKPEIRLTDKIKIKSLKSRYYRRKNKEHINRLRRERRRAQRQAQK